MYPLIAKIFIGDDFEANLEKNFAAHVRSTWVRNSNPEMLKRTPRKFF